MRQESRAEAQVRASYRRCRRLTRETSHTEYALTQLLPPPLRPAAFALYAALRTADDLIDGGDGTPAERIALLEAWTRDLSEEVRRGASTDPIRCALVDTLSRWDLDHAEFTVALQALTHDADGTGPVSWEQWRSRVQAQNSGWVQQVAGLLEWAGLSAVPQLTRLPGCARLLDGLYLTDTLGDLADDLGRGVLTLPAEVLDRFPGAAADLAAFRWTAPVRALADHLLGCARQWLRAGHAELRGQLPLGADIVLETVVAFFLARLDAFERAGPAVLRRPTLPGPLARWRVLGPARARAFLLWRLLPAPTVPEAAQPTRPEPSDSPPALEAPLPPPPHPSGARPPAPERRYAPRHVAVIMDGNGRWATQRGLPRSEGHRAGAGALREVAYGALEAGLPHLTVYVFSTENWRRSADEVTRLFQLLHEEIATDVLLDHDVRLRWLGDRRGLPPDLVGALLDQERATRARTGLTLSVCFNYGGRAELTRAAASTACAALAGDLDPARLSPRELARHLPYPELPEVDLLWRTGGESRLSNFLPWHTAYAELHFTDTLWPDVDRRDLWQAMNAYSNRERRYGTAPRDTGTARLDVPCQEGALGGTSPAAG